MRKLKTKEDAKSFLTVAALNIDANVMPTLRASVIKVLSFVGSQLVVKEANKGALDCPKKSANHSDVRLESYSEWDYMYLDGTRINYGRTLRTLNAEETCT